MAVSSVGNEWIPQLWEHAGAKVFGHCVAWEQDIARRYVSWGCGVVQISTWHQRSHAAATLSQQGRNLLLVMLLDARRLGHWGAATAIGKAKSSGGPHLPELVSITLTLLAQGPAAGQALVF